MAKDYAEELKRIMYQSRLKNAAEMLERENQKEQVEKLSKVGYSKGYDAIEAYKKGKEHGEAMARAKVQREVWKAAKVMDMLKDMPTKAKREYVGVKNKALVPKRGMKAGPLKD